MIRASRLLIGILTLLGGCGTTPTPFGQALEGSLIVLDRSEPATVDDWRRWLESHPPERLLAPNAPGIDSTPIPEWFEATAYAAPILSAVRRPDSDHRHSILGPPPEEIPASELPTRREQAAEPHLGPAPLGWVADGLDAYLAEVNGSVALRFPDGTLACLDWVRTNERPYTSLGRRLIEEGHAEAEGLTLKTIRRLHQRDPELVESLMLDNDRMVYFQTIPRDRWPESSTGVRLVPRHAAAVDPRTIPLGSVLLVERPDGTRLIAMAVDTGGAIVGRRIDLFLGVGEEAMAEAGDVVESVRISILRPGRSGSEIGTRMNRGAIDRVAASSAR